MKLQKDLDAAWAKVKLNSIYYFPPITPISIVYDENVAHQITEEGKKHW